jgi:hypothetical protein
MLADTGSMRVSVSMSEDSCLVVESRHIAMPSEARRLSHYVAGSARHRLAASAHCA